MGILDQPSTDRVACALLSSGTQSKIHLGCLLKEMRS